MVGKIDHCGRDRSSRRRSATFTGIGISGPSWFKTPCSARSAASTIRPPSDLRRVAHFRFKRYLEPIGSASLTRSRVLLRCSNVSLKYLGANFAFTSRSSRLVPRRSRFISPQGWSLAQTGSIRRGPVPLFSSNRDHKCHEMIALLFVVILNHPMLSFGTG